MDGGDNVEHCAVGTGTVWYIWYSLFLHQLEVSLEHVHIRHLKQPRVSINKDKIIFTLLVPTVGTL